MSGLEFAWCVALLATLCLLPVGVIRTVIYRSGEIDHTPAMRTVAMLVLVLGLVGLLAFVALTVAIFA